MKKIKIIFLILTTVMVVSKVAGQDPNITQFQNAPMYYNPAYTGLYTGVRARFLFRDQAPALPYDFRAYHFSADFGNRNLMAINHDMNTCPLDFADDFREVRFRVVDTQCRFHSHIVTNIDSLVKSGYF